MALINMQQTGAGAGGATADFSGDLDGVIRSNDVAYFPCRPAPYRLDRTLVLDGVSPQILCDPGVTIEGVAGQPIFHSVAAGQRARIRGGHWRGGSALLTHTGVSALQLLRVEAADVSDFDVAFDLPTQVIAFVWRDCSVFECGVGLRMGGVANVHTISDCTFSGCGTGVLLEHQLDNRLQLAIERCAFVSNEAGVVIDGAAQQALAIRHCHLHGNADADIVLRLPAGGNWIDTVSIERCDFGPPSATQTERIRSVGQVSFRAVQCQAIVHPPTLVFASIAPAAYKYATWLDRNRLSFATGTYADAALRAVGLHCTQITEPQPAC